MTKLFAAYDSLRLDKGGVARVSRLFDRYFAKSNLNYHKVTFLDYDNLGCSGSKFKFVRKVFLKQFTCQYFFYSFLGLARSHHLNKLVKRPFASFAHGIEVWPGEYFKPERIEAAKRANLLLCNSQNTKFKACEADKTFERAKVIWLSTEEDVLPNEIFSNKSLQINGKTINSDNFNVLMIGRIEEDYKGHAEMIQSWPHVVDSNPNAQLYIAGRGPRAEFYQKLAEQSSVRSHIHFLGFVPDEIMPQLWAKTSIFAMPSRGEGFGLVYIEAMRYGVPVIASIHDSGKEVNIDGETGYNVDMDKKDELPERIIDLLKNLDRAREFGRNGQARWMKHFRFSAFCDRVAPVFDEFLKG